jgi:hypothetical protein
MVGGDNNMMNYMQHTHMFDLANSMEETKAMVRKYL